MRYCVNPRKTLLFLPETLPTSQDCKGDSAWKKCLLSAILSSSKVNSIQSQNLSTYLERRTYCFEKTVKIPKEVYPLRGVAQYNSFLEFSWFGRRCVGQSSCKSRISSRSQIIPLPASKLEGTISFFRKAAREFSAFGERDKKRGVSVVVYNRADTSKRRWLNANDVEDYIRGKNIPDLTLKMYNYTPQAFAEQIHLYSSSSILIAPHGAAMANTIFMQPGSEVIEITRGCKNISSVEHVPQSWTGWSAAHSGLHLQYVNCYFENSNSTNQNYSPYTVNVTEMSRAIDEAIERQLFENTASSLYRRWVGRFKGSDTNNDYDRKEGIGLSDHFLILFRFLVVISIFKILKIPLWPKISKL